jgi:predicted MFS family arabinose efflux permease
MALNLGFSIGPALGGFFAAVSYHLLFYGNAFSSAVAGTVFYFYFRKKEKDRISADALRKNTGTQLPGRSPWQDRKFVVFSILGVFYSIFFFQLLTTLPLYYKEVYRLKDWDIGLLLAFNGLVVFTLEMFIVSTAERLLTIRKIIVLGSLFCASSFLVLIPGKHLLILYFGIFLLSLSEILTMPFMATVAVSRATRGKEGAYMGLNSLSFSSAHIISPIAGTVIATRYGFDILWEISGLVALLTAVGFWINLKQMAIQDKSLPALSIE